MNSEIYLSQDNIIIWLWLLWSILGLFSSFKENSPNTWNNRILILIIYILTIISALLFTEIPKIINDIWPIYSMWLLSLPLIIVVSIAYKNFIYTMTEYNFFYRTMWLIIFAIISNSLRFISIALTIAIVNLYFILPNKQIEPNIVIYLYIISMISASIIFGYVFWQDREYINTINKLSRLNSFMLISLGNLFVYIWTKLIILLLLLPIPSKEINYRIPWYRIRQIKDKMYANYHISIQWNWKEYWWLLIILWWIIILGKIYIIPISWQLWLFRIAWKTYLYRISKTL